MISRVRALARVALLATALAVLGFGAAGYGVFGAVPPTSAILETTSQSPVSVVPRPSPVIVPSRATAAAPLSTASPWLVVLLLGGVVVAAALVKRSVGLTSPR